MKEKMEKESQDEKVRGDRREADREVKIGLILLMIETRVEVQHSLLGGHDCRYNPAPYLFMLVIMVDTTIYAHYRQIHFQQ